MFGRSARLKRKYGIDQYDYAQMWEEQDGRCRICSKYCPGNKMVVDHDHDTGEVRGLLCSKCNSGIGLLGECTTALSNAIKYLKGD